MLYGYIRIQGKNNDLELKKKVLEEKGCEKIFLDISSIYRNNRPNLSTLINLLEKDDCLIIDSLINLSREIVDCGNIIEKILLKKAKLIILDLGIIDTSEENKMIIDTIRAMIKLKKDSAIEKAKVGKEVVGKNKKFKDGRPKKYSRKQIENALNLLTVNGGKLSYNEVSQLTKISKSTLIREMKYRKGKDDTF